MKTEPVRRWDRETALVAWFAGCVSVISFLLYLRRGEILLYGDAVAHINIARRVFDSRTPGLLQLGTVWLPLPHLLMIPFLLHQGMWTSGLGGSIPSMAAYVAGVTGIFRLTRRSAAFTEGAALQASLSAWGAAIIYGANPNLIYLQATAMTEALYLGLFIWAAVYLTEFASQVEVQDSPPICSSALLKCGACLVAACLTRYDGWMLALAMAAAACVIAVFARTSSIRRSVRNFVLLAAAGPVLWLAYNAIVYRNPVEFATGPYSAKAIEQKTPGASHPGGHNLPVAFSYFLKSAELNLGAGNWQKLWITLALAGIGFGVWAKRQASPRPARWPLLFLWVPLAFYPLSVAYGGVPVFIPEWWPYSYYNARYGVQLLPAFAVFTSLAVAWLVRRGKDRKTGIAIAAAGCIFVFGSYASIWRNPVSYREAWVNSRTRMAIERELADYLKALPADSTLLMYLGDHVGALQQAGIPLRRVIYEGNHRTWKQPLDPEGLWERALADPPRFADFVIAFDGDAVSAAIQKRDLAPLGVFHVSGQPAAAIYRTERR